MSNTKDILPKENEVHNCAEFLFNYITGISDGECEKERMKMEIPPGRVFSVWLTVPQNDANPKTAAQICNIFKAEGVNTPLLFCRCIGNYVIAIAEGYTEAQIQTMTARAWNQSGKRLFTIFECGLACCDLYSVYDRLEKQLERVFYADDGVNAVKAEYGKHGEMGQCNPTLEAVSRGDIKNAEIYIGSLFRLIECIKPPVAYTKDYLAGLYADLLMQNMQHTNAAMIKAAAKIGAAKHISEAQTVISETVKKLAFLNIPENGESYSALVKETIHIINGNIGNEELSLRWIAKSILYTNVDYLGKVFKKETGRNFSHYVMEKRMEAAKKCILDDVCYKIYEVAERVGFGSNSQYFSQVFKKYTGVSPLEYREYAKALRVKEQSV